MRGARIIAWIVILAGPAGAAPLRITGETMGTTYAVTVARPAAALDVVRLRDEIEATLARVDAQASTWRADSELSRFNDDRSTVWHPVSADLAALVAEALRTSRWSEGAFDPTVAPLVDLWGFGPHGGPRRPPAATTIHSVRARVGFAHLAAREAPPALRKSLPELRLDLSAIAKGFAVDRVTERLEGLGADDVLVEIGGEVRARGLDPTGDPWAVAVQQPTGALGTASAILHITDAAVATSGDYRNHFEWDHIRYGHVIDPRTGAPVAHGLASVTIVARSAMRADALATALLVLGPEDGLARARRERIAALFITRADDGFRTHSTAAFRTYMTR